ncbi:protease adaptor protein RcdA [Faunimonas sp. B44]|uniref:protease adaptor protein RcdA n=1 Tax=Faunimonas sp. B44 TaxID=3461493 RepID=UPI004044C7F8
MNRRRTDTDQPISFGRAYTQSETFRALYQDGMKLVEATAAYLDGEGRRAAKALHRPASVLYATESMRLTTRLMQLASWLLLHRSVIDGEMSPAQASEEKRKIRIEGFSTETAGPAWQDLPDEFRELVLRSLSLQKRVESIDACLLDDAPPVVPNPVQDQIDALRQALAVRR